MAPRTNYVRLTKSRIDSLPVPSRAEGTKIYRDNRLCGFGLRITPQGARSFIVERRVNGRNRRVTIGAYGLLTPDDARRRAQQHLGQMAAGTDPAAKQKADQVMRVTLREALDALLIVRKNLKPRTRADYRRHLEKSFGDWADRPLASITGDDIQRRHVQLGKKSHAQANLAMRYLRAIMNFATVHYELPDGRTPVQRNPVRQLTRTRGWYKVERRRTHIKPHQFSPFWAALQALHSSVNPAASDTARDYFTLLLFTGLRRSEAAGLRWPNVDLVDRTLRIEDTKNGSAHELPLPEYLVTMLRRRQECSASEWVFPNGSGTTGIKELRHHQNKIIKVSGVHFCAHDLRRTFATIADSLDISAYALKRLLNHQNSGDVTSGYVTHSVERLRDPMERIAMRILLLASVPLELELTKAA